MISQSTPCGSLRPEESWLGSKRQWREWELRWQTTWRSWRVSTTENPRSKDTSPGSIENWRKQTTLKCRERESRPNQKARECTLWHRAWKTGKARSPLHEQSNPPVPDQQNPWDIQTAPPWRHHTGWAHSHPVSWARNYHRIDSHSHRHGDLDPCACAHRRQGKCAGVGSQATWQEQFERVCGKKKHLQALRRALANLAGKAAAALPGIIGSIVSWLLSTLGKTAINFWALAIAVGTLLLVAARDWLARR